MNAPSPTHLAEAPWVPLQSLDILWFQVGGTICNLRCHHCFISCSPENDTFGFMSLELCSRYLREGVALGAKEFYFTGGEPFANPDLCDILEDALRYGPSTVLTNATLFRDTTMARLRRMRQASAHVLELRVSIDGYTSAMNDPIRGQGTFDRAMEGIGRLVQSEFNPIITIMRSWAGCDEEVLSGFTETLRAVGYAEPRLKILPSIKLGAEARRTRGYSDCERVTHEMMCGFDLSKLICSHARLLTDRGVWVCPILPDAPEARMSDSVSNALGGYPLRHQACFTCWKHGAICLNSSGAGCSGNDVRSSPR